jgi:hypothetical protein
MLRIARHNRGLGLDEVAAATRIKEPYLSALEDGDYSQLPGPAYVTGFLRNYAGFLGLHPDDVVQEYYASRPLPPTSVKAATRVLANGYHRETRTRLLWIFGVVIMVLAGAYAIKQYNDSTAHANTAPPVNVTASGLAGTISPTPATNHAAQRTLRVHLQALAPVWVRVTVDSHRAFQGILRAQGAGRTWVGHHSVYVVTWDGAHLRARFNGRTVGLLASKPGVMVDEATASGWRRVS